MLWREAVVELAKVTKTDLFDDARRLITQVSEADRVGVLARMMVEEAKEMRRRSVYAIEVAASRVGSVPSPSAKAPQRVLRAARASTVQQVARRLAPVLTAWRDHLHVEWTEELLHTSFSLGDGRIVTWGAATVLDHQERVALFLEKGSICLDGAAKHEAAIQVIQASAGSCLRDVVGRALAGVR